MQRTTTFDPSEHHIYLLSHIVDWQGIVHTFSAILDTGAPTTEFSDDFLNSIGLLRSKEPKKVDPLSLEQTKKYGKLAIPKIKCLGHEMKNVTVKVSKFAEGWGIDALIGLDFFRQFRVTVDYGKAEIVTEPLVII